MTQTAPNAHPVKRIGAIDLGTNSFHAIIVDIYPDGSYRRIDELKEMVMLAQGGMKNLLSEEAMNRGIEALGKIKVLFENHEIEKTLAYATSAIREARNGGEFIQRAIDEVGIKPLAIPGSMEAELIGLAVQHGLSLGEEPVLMVDIGGGSVEFIIGNRDELFFHESYKIGSTRMASDILTQDPVSNREIKKLTAIYAEALSRMRKVLRTYPVKTIVGSSGTMKNIAQIIANRKSLSTSLTLNELTFSAKDFRAFYKEFIKLDHAKRLNIEGLDKKRVDIMIPGVVLVHYLLKEFGVDTIRISEDALREGMVIHYIKKKSKKLNLNADFPDPRRRSVFELLRKCDWHEDHSRHVTTTALQIFDHLQEELGLDGEDRDLLEYASLMHDIGYHISQRNHHKHALYLIRHSDLRGFREEEIEVMANVARYHRKSTPKDRHKHFRKLDKSLQSKIKKLAGILRIADGMDRSHYQNVRALEIDIDKKEIHIHLTTLSDPQLEIWGAMRKSQLFEEITGRTLRITTSKSDVSAVIE